MEGGVAPDGVLTIWFPFTSPHDFPYVKLSHGVIRTTHEHIIHTSAMVLALQVIDAIIKYVWNERDALDKALGVLIAWGHHGLKINKPDLQACWSQGAWTYLCRAGNHWSPSLPVRWACGRLRKNPSWRGVGVLRRLWPGWLCVAVAERGRQAATVDDSQLQSGPTDLRPQHYPVNSTADASPQHYIPAQNVDPQFIVCVVCHKRLCACR